MNLELILTIGGIVFALIVLNAVFLGIIFYMRRKMDQVSAWPSTQGVVTSSSVESRSSEDGYTDYPVVRYSYQVSGQAHKGSRIAPGPEIGGSGARKVTARYAQGAPITVYYNPQNPADAVLEKKAPAQGLMWVILVIFDVVLCISIPLAAWGILKGGG